ncbi:MAG: tetratricopeptide repeat protein, partial [Rhodospirillales bacterium]|nr:tetratricopeptide repeat protein [Rhodospirillales bacterium]
MVKDAKPLQSSHSISEEQAQKINKLLDHAVQFRSTGDLSNAEICYRQIIEIDPNSVDAHFNLGRVLDELGRHEDAVSSYRDALRFNPDHAESYNNLGLTLWKLGKADEIIECYCKAIDINPEYTEAYINLGCAFNDIGMYDRAIASYLKAITLTTEVTDAYINLAVIFKEQYKLDDAIFNYHRRILEDTPNQLDALNQLGEVARYAGEYEIAINLFSKALTIDPNISGVHFNLGRTFSELDKPDEAIFHYCAAIDRNPNFTEAYINLGSIFYNLEKYDKAVVNFTKAISINPDIAEAYNNLGMSYRIQGKLDDAILNYQKAVNVKPDFAGAYNSLGSAYKEAGMQDDAIESYKKAIAIKPDFAAAYNNLGLITKDNDSLVYLQKAVDCDPYFDNAYNNLGRMQMQAGKHEDAIVSFRKAISINPEFFEAHSNLIFYMSFLSQFTIQNIYEEARNWNTQNAYKGGPLKHHNTPEPDRTLRIGLVSNELNAHSVSYFLINIFSEIDTNKFQIYAYATSPVEDAQTHRIQSVVSNWRKVSDYDDDQLATIILADEIDILIDLSGHTGNNRLKLFSRKPAPIQVSWLGFNGTTGLDAIDYILCDKRVIPSSEAAYFSEEPWYLPDIWLCFSKPDHTVDIGPLPALANGHITFGSFNNLPKISDKTVSCWSKILHAVTDSHLLLKAKGLAKLEVQDETYARFEAHGIPRNRIVLKSFTPTMDEHLRIYNEIDIALDTFPYSGVTTSIEAFSMGVPVLNLKGNHFVSHAGE